MIGGQAGHFFSTQAMPHTNSWSITPAAEIEGFYIGRNTITGYQRGKKINIGTVGIITPVV